MNVICLLQEREGRHPRGPDPDVGRMCRDTAAGLHTIAQCTRQWRPLGVGVHAAVARRRVGRRSERRGSRGRPGMRCEVVGKSCGFLGGGIRESRRENGEMEGRICKDKKFKTNWKTLTPTTQPPIQTFLGTRHWHGQNTQITIFYKVKQNTHGILPQNVCTSTGPFWDDLPIIFFRVGLGPHPPSSRIFLLCKAPFGTEN